MIRLPNVIALCAAMAAMASGAERPKPPATPKVTQTNGVYYMEVAGTPYDMGMQRGLAMARPIRRSIQAYKSRLTRTFGQYKAPLLINWAVAKAGFAADVRTMQPDIWAEIEGIAAGAGVSAKEILMLNFSGEIYQAAASELGLQPVQTFGHGGTAFLAKAPNKRFMGQNVDFSDVVGRQPLVIRYEYPGKQVLLYTLPGAIGGVGVNSRGVAVGATVLPEGHRRAGGGLGAAFQTRAALQQDSVDAALAKLESVKRFSSMAFVIAGFDKAVAVETSPEEFIAEATDEQTPVIVRTNHAMRLAKRDANGQPAPGGPLLSSERHAAAAAVLADNLAKLDVDVLRRMLVAQPINMHNDRLTTLQTLIVEYDGANVRMFASAGSDAKRPWNEYDFDRPSEAGSKKVRSRIASEVSTDGK